MVKRAEGTVVESSLEQECVLCVYDTLSWAISDQALRVIFLGCFLIGYLVGKHGCLW